MLNQIVYFGKVTMYYVPLLGYRIKYCPTWYALIRMTCFSHQGDVLISTKLHINILGYSA